MRRAALISPINDRKKRIVTAKDLHWIKWSFSPDRWGFSLQEKWYLNTLLAFFCSVINAYSKQGQEIGGIDVPLDWLLDRCFGPSLSRSTLKRALEALKGDFIDCPRKRPGNQGKRILFNQNLCDICLHGSTRATFRNNKDRKGLESKRQVNTKQLNTNKEELPANEKKRIPDVLKTLLIVARDRGVDELGQKRLFARCMAEIERVNRPGSEKNLIDWEYYREKWRKMGFTAREGIARVDILPVLLPKERKKPENRKPDIIEPENPVEIRKLILKSLGV